HPKKYWYQASSSTMMSGPLVNRGGALATGVHGENSDVLPARSVAVAVSVTFAKASTAGQATVVVNRATPSPAVSMNSASRKVVPSPKPLGSQPSLLNSSIRNCAFGVLVM